MKDKKSIFAMALLCLLMTFASRAQDVQAVQIEDKTFYALDKVAAQNIIKRAQKGLYFDQYKSEADRLLNSVLKAKVKADSIQLIQQQDIATCQFYLLRSEHELMRERFEYREAIELRGKAKKQRNVMAGIAAVAIIMLGLSL